MSKKGNIGIVLLAAGASSRMGHNKLKLVYKNKTMLENLTNAAIDSQADKVIVVLGANVSENQLLLSGTKVEIVINDNWENGIGSSIKCGLKEMLRADVKLQAVIVSVCDQPYLTKKVFNNLIDAYLKSEKQVVASSYSNSLGVPVLYDKSLFGELSAIPDAHGAKKYIVDQASEKNIESVSFPKGEIDIDTIDDIMKLTPF